MQATTATTVRCKQLQLHNSQQVKCKQLQLHNSQMETNATVRCKQLQQSDTHNYIVQQEKTTNNLPQAHTDNHIFHTGTWPVLILLIL